MTLAIVSPASQFCAKGRFSFFSYSEQNTRKTQVRSQLSLMNLPSELSLPYTCIVLLGQRAEFKLQAVWVFTPH